MKKLLICITIALLLPMMTNAQTYGNLWKQVKEASQKDLPQTEQEVLTQIIQKAEQEQAYGQLLKAELQRAKSLCDVSPDSLTPVVERLKEREAQASGNTPLQAIYNCVLGYIYTENRWLDEDRHEDIGRDYYTKALAHPEELARVKATDYDPFVVKGIDSKFFDDDLLSVIAYEAKRYDIMRDTYVKMGNRRAALLAADMLLGQEEPDEMEPLNKSKHIQRIDSLINEYQDLVECGEAAMSRYDYMDEHTDATAEQKWQYINMALERWGDWQRMNYLRTKQRDLCELNYEAIAEQSVNIPQRVQAISLTELRGINELTMRVYKADVEGNTELNPQSTNGYKKLKPLLTPLPQFTVTRQYVGKRPYELFEDSMQLSGLPVGVYMLEFESQPATQTSRCLYFVSDLRVICQLQPGDQMRLVAVNATTGQPVKGATIEVSHGYGKEKKVKKLTSDDNGEYLYTQGKDDYSNYELRAYTASDKACPTMDVWGRFRYDDNNGYSLTTNIYTDRAIYRPGQTVHAAAIVYTTDNGRDFKAKEGQTINMQLRDANHKVVSEQKVTTDRFGTATARFTLPSQGLTGMFTLSANYTSHSFRVEEYKRPAFEVDIPRVAQNYEDGDTVVARGTARSYAGVPVQGAKVKYKVVRRKAYWWMTYSRYWGGGIFGTGSDDETVAEGETVTDDKGVFTADMPMVLPKTRYTMFYNFVLTADVTDQAGETHQGQMSLPLGNRKTAFSVTLPEKVLSEGDVKMAFHQQNAAGIDLEARVRYRFDNGRWQEAKTNELIAIPQLKSGKHTLHAVTVANAAANSTPADTLDQEFVMFSLDDARPATDTRSWFYVSREQFPMSGEPVTVQAGSSDKNVHVVYSVFSGDNILESGTVDLSNELINRKFKYEDSYGDGLLLTFAWMKEGKAYHHSTTIRRPMPDMHLDLKWSTFRNRLTPGQQEEWTLAITKPDGTPAEAQLMATLYDKSLDQLEPHAWNLTPTPRLSLPSTYWRSGSWGRTVCEGQKHQGRLYAPTLSFNRFDHSLYPSYRYFHNRPMRMMRMRGVNSSAGMVEEEMLYDVAPVMLEVSENEVAMAKQTATDEALQGRIAGLDKAGLDKGEEEAEGTVPVQMRENLQETAFFMPQLVADSTGLVKMKFTLPESLTTWCFLGVAHTQDMMFGEMSDEAVAKKDLMIQPNMPRFLRQDDQGTISARVMNMSNQTLSGTATMQLLDPATEQVLVEQKQQVSVADSSTVSVSFQLKPADSRLQAGLYIVRMSITTKNFSDGEQHYLPVLPSKERVTVTVPFTQTAPGTKEIDLSKLIPVNDPQAKLTIEYTNNPAWMMIQALPAVGHPHDDCAVCQATSFYANGIGRHILDQNPSAKHVFEQWSREQGAETSLMSNLSKDEELKDVMLSETPWVMDADREQEQKQRLADFFDQNLIGQRIATAVKNLDKLQNGDGSWSWWPGMKGSVWMTTSVAEMLVRLNAMTGPQDETKKMLNKAFGYLGDDIVELVDEMKKQEKKGYKQTFPSFRALQWLYICAIDGRQLSKKVAEANSYLINLLKKDTKNQTIYEKALSAVILDNKTYVRSLKEWTVYREDMGRYYDTQRAAYSWRDYKIPTQVAAIEALKRLTPQDTVTISEMQRWLLQEKRTQSWDTPLNSVDAIYAFLNGNSLALAPQAKTVLAIDHKPLDTSNATAGLGYVKQAQTYNGEKTFTAEKTSTGTSWGAVYAQFTQPTHDISDQASGLSVKRELRINQPTTPTPPTTPTLTIGDRITVRITIEADRDYDFVELQDKRAACMEPVKQLSGYNWREGYYCTPKDHTTSYFFDLLPKGRHIIETEYYIDREGTYETGTCTVQCAYSPEFRGTTKSQTLTVKPKK